MTVKLTSLKVDIAKERDGEWIDLPTLPGVALLVRGTNYGPFQAEKDIIEQKWLRKYKGKPVPPEVKFEANGELYAKHILLGWRGFDVTWTPEIGRETLLDPEFRELQDHVRYAMGMVGIAQVEFLEEGDEAAVKNSAGPSAST